MKKDKLKKVLQEVLQVDYTQLDENQKFIDMEEWDSMTFMMFIASLEQEFEMTFSNEEILEMDTVRSTIKVLDRKTNNK